MKGQHHVGETPILRFTVRDQDDAVVDVSSASGAGTKLVLMRKPDGTILSKTATFTTTGTDGKVQYQVLTSDFDAQGEWEVQAKVIITAGTFYSPEERFDVVGVLA